MTGCSTNVNSQRQPLSAPMVATREMADFLRALRISPEV